MVGVAELFLTAAHDEYVDYQIIQVPIHLKKINIQYITIFLFSINCYGAIAPQQQFWAIGNAELMVLAYF